MAPCLPARSGSTLSTLLTGLRGAGGMHTFRIIDAYIPQAAGVRSDNNGDATTPAPDTEPPAEHEAESSSHAVAGVAAAAAAIALVAAAGVVVKWRKDATELTIGTPSIGVQLAEAHLPDRSHPVIALDLSMPSHEQAPPDLESSPRREQHGSC